MIEPAKDFLEKKYQEKKKNWSNAPVGPKWKQFVVEVMDEYKTEIVNSVLTEVSKKAKTKEVRCYYTGLIGVGGHYYTTEVDRDYILSLDTQF